MTDDITTATVVPSNDNVGQLTSEPAAHANGEQISINADEFNAIRDAKALGHDIAKLIHDAMAKA